MCCPMLKWHVDYHATAALTPCHGVDCFQESQMGLPAGHPFLERYPQVVPRQNDGTGQHSSLP